MDSNPYLEQLNSQEGQPLPITSEQMKQTVDGYMAATMYQLQAEINEASADDIVQACAQLANVELEIVGQIVMQINQQGHTTIGEAWTQQIQKVVCNAMQNFLTRNCPVDYQSERTAEQLAALDIIERIHDVIIYLETFCCIGKPAQWSLPLRELHGEPQNQQEVEKKDDDLVAKLDQKLQKAFAVLKESKGKAMKLLDDDAEGIHKVVGQQRELLLTRLVPNFVAENMMNYKMLHQRQQAFKRDKIEQAWTKLMEPFVAVVQTGQPFDLAPSQQSLADGLQLLVWSNLPCNQFRIEHLQKETLLKILDPTIAAEAPLYELGMQTTHDVQHFKVKIQDIYDNMATLVTKFKAYECHLTTMITLALRVFVRHNPEELADPTAGSFTGASFFAASPARYTVRATAAQCREILHNFFTTVYGQMEGRIGLATVESFISQIQTGQRLPETQTPTGYDLALFLDASFKATNQQQEQQEGVMAAMIKKMQTVTSGEAQQIEEQRPEDQDQFHEKNNRYFKEPNQVREAQRIQMAALAFSAETVQKWQNKNPKIGKQKEKDGLPFLPTCQLEKLSEPGQGPSKTSTVIAISGFMSHDSDKMDEWGAFCQYFKEQRQHSNVYALNWEAKNVRDIWAEKGNNIVKGVFGGGVSMLAAKAAGAGTAVAGVVTAAQVYQGYQDSKDVFLSAKAHSKLAGKMLACALACSYPFETQTVSLVGFSLGTQVTKSCLKTLHQFGMLSKGQHSKIQNVTLMGGAISFTGLGKEQKWRKIMGETVAANIRNIYSQKDYVLYGYSATHDGKQTAGRNHLNFEDELTKMQYEKLTAVYSQELLNFKNRNITQIGDAKNKKVLEAVESGHLEYRGVIMNKVQCLIEMY